MSPTAGSESPTNAPSESPTVDGGAVQEDTPTVAPTKVSNAAVEGESEGVNGIYVVIAIMSICVCLLTCAVFISYLRRKRAEERKVNDHMQIQHIRSGSNQRRNLQNLKMHSLNSNSSIHKDTGSIPGSPHMSTDNPNSFGPRLTMDLGESLEGGNDSYNYNNNALNHDKTRDEEIDGGIMTGLDMEESPSPLNEEDEDDIIDGAMTIGGDLDMDEDDHDDLAVFKQKDIDEHRQQNINNEQDDEIIIGGIETMGGPQNHNELEMETINRQQTQGNELLNPNIKQDEFII